MAKQENAHSMIDSLIKTDAYEAGLKGLLAELANRKEAGTYAHPMGDDPNAWNVADVIKAIHQGQDEHLYKGEPYQESDDLASLIKNPYWKTSYGAGGEGEWSTGYRSTGLGNTLNLAMDYEGERAYRKKMLEDANVLDYKEDEGIDWFNPGRWGQSLKKTILDALTTK